MSVDAQNLLEVLDTALPVSIRHIRYRLRDVGRKLDMRTALCGGVARDLLRTVSGGLDVAQLAPIIQDFDVVVEGDGVEFGYGLVRRLPGELTINQAFNTATLRTNDGNRIDITTARLEHYETPGALPTVTCTGVSLEQDLARRDFSANALAIELSHQVGKLIDPLGGAGDVRDRVLRALHPASFIDDPTRLFRALRYGVRLDFDIEGTTLELMNAAIRESLLDHLTPERIRYEVECIGKEPRWVEIWAVADLMGLNGAISYCLSGVSRDWKLEDAAALDIGLKSRQDLLDDAGLERWLVRTGWVLKHVRPDLAEDAMVRLGLYGRNVKLLLAALKLLRNQVPALASLAKPSEICKRLEGYSRLAIVCALFMMTPTAEDEVTTRKQLLRYLEQYNTVRSELDGNDLLKLGFKPGPLLGRVRDELRYLRLDGVITTVEDEMKYAKKFVSPGSRQPEGEG